MSGFDLVVANYNNGRFLSDLIKSIESQTHDNWHLHIVDDCSTDESRQILSKYSAHKKISILYHDKNLGVCATFHHGIINGSKRYVGLIGADDSLQPKCIELCNEEFINQPEASMIYTQAYKCDEQLKELGVWEATQQINYLNHITEELPKIFNFICFRRTAYQQTKGLNLQLRKAMDHDLILKLSRVGKIHYFPRLLYNYRCHNGGISQGSSGLMAAQYSLQCQINHLKETKDLSRSQIRKIHHLYHTRSGFTGHSCENKTPFMHSVISIYYSNNLRDLKTSLVAILKSLNS